MSTRSNKIIDDALSLPSDERIFLVEKLIMSLNLPVHAEIEQCWAEEAERRLSQLARGEAELIPGNEVFDRIRRKYAK